MKISSKKWLEVTKRLSPRDRRSFEKYIKTHSETWKLFQELCFDAMRAGQMKWSARSIIHVIRWEYTIKRESREFKISDHHSSFFSRLFALKYPKYKSFFSYKRN